MLVQALTVATMMNKCLSQRTIFYYIINTGTSFYTGTCKLSKSKFVISTLDFGWFASHSSPFQRYLVVALALIPPIYSKFGSQHNVVSVNIFCPFAWNKGTGLYKEYKKTH